MIQGKTVMINMWWRFAERCGTQIVSFVVSLVLARLLLPEDYGIVSLITVFTGILTLFVDAGFSKALIQKQNTDQVDYSTVFYFNMALGTVLFLGMCIAAPWIADFYENSSLVPYIRVLSLTLVVGGVNVVQEALVAKRMQYKRFFYSSLGGTLLSAVVGIGMALMGFGVWALIAQKLVDQVTDTAILWFTVRWRPSLCFSISRLKPLASYGSKLLGSSVLNTFYQNLTGLLVGKLYSASQLAYYDKGQRLPSLMVYNFKTAIQSVLLPVMAEQQSETERLRQILRQSVLTAAYCGFPCMVGMAVCAQPLIRVLFTERWIQMTPYMQLWCLYFLTYLIDAANLQVIQALGRSDLFLKLEIIKQSISVVGVLLAAPFGALAMLGVACGLRPLLYYIDAAPNRRLVGYGFWEQFKDLRSIMALNVGLAVLVGALGFLPLPDLALLAVQVCSGAAFYVGVSAALRMETFVRLLALAKKMVADRKRGAKS